MKPRRRRLRDVRTRLLLIPLGALASAASRGEVASAPRRALERAASPPPRGGEADDRAPVAWSVNDCDCRFRLREVNDD